MTDPTVKVAVTNVLRPGKPRLVDARRYEAMRRAVQKTLPSAEPGITVAELRARLMPLLPEAVFPGGAKAGWWLKTVQLDLEDKGTIVRTRSTPLRLYRSKR